MPDPIIAYRNPDSLETSKGEVTLKISDDDLDLEIEYATLNVNSVQMNSGIFIGNNQSHHWRSYIKINNGFGTMRSSILSHSLNIVVDNDVVDTVITDTSENQDVIPTKKDTTAHTTTLKLDNINTNSLHQNATLSIGENNQRDWRTHNKYNNGLGILTGSNKVDQSTSMIEDNDKIDTVISDDRSHHPAPA